MDVLKRLINTFVFACVSPIANEWIVEQDGEFFTIPCINVSNIISNSGSSNEITDRLNKAKVKINLVDTNEWTLEQLKTNMETNGYSYDNPTQYKLKNNQACYIPENADNLNDVESWLSMYIKAFKYYLTSSAILDLCESYDKDNLIPEIEEEAKNDKLFNPRTWIKKITNQSIEQVIVTKINLFMDETDKWTSFDTYLTN